MADLARAKGQRGNFSATALPRASQERLSGIAALYDEIPDDPVARKAMRERLVARLKEKLSDPGNAGMLHDEFIRNRPLLR